MNEDNINTTIARAALESVYDPEIGLNVIDLGLIYDLVVDRDKVDCTMTLTTQFCPMGESIISQVEDQLKKTFPEKTIHVELTFDPPWGPHRISEEGNEILNG